jgi:hypothetical protein
MDALADNSPSPRHEFFYFNDDGSWVALPYNQWKIVFAEQRAHDFDVWQEPFTTLRLPKILNPVLILLKAQTTKRWTMDIGD